MVNRDPRERAVAFERTSVATIVAAVESPVDRLQIASAVDGIAHVRFTNDLRANRDRGSLWPRAFLIELTNAVAMPSATIIRELRGYDSLTPVIAYGTLSAGMSDHLIAAVRAGAEYFILKGHDDVRNVVSVALQREQFGRVTEAVMSSFDRRMPKRAAAIIHHCVARAARPMTVDELAGLVGLHRRTLARQMHAFGLPSAEATIGWGRLLVAACLIEETDAPVEAIALRLGFMSVSALRTMFKRYTGLGPGDISRLGGFATVMQRFAIAGARRTE